ncbi:MAG TPA: cell division protein ZipA C-terminal FtsZ-binding domain-containing protein [Steroidobacteraceae bacterium]|jgi:cell division protein ZipA|nr:cell division protein ZipA C-terminal FtsZ-binding domain-containing protein [Steroidobacteraceae bacterium]
MTWLRPILLLAGALFIGLLIWWERRRPRQAAQTGGARAERGEAVLDVSTPVTVERPIPPPERPPPERTDTRNRELHRTPPVIGWSDAGAMDNAAAEISTADQGAQARQPELIVDWPSEEARRIVTLRILPARQDRLAGRALRQGLAACGFRHGQFGIFHLAGEDGRVVISAASLVRPGMLDPTTMDFQRFAGINVFAVLPGPVSAEVALQQLAQVAVEVAARVGGRVQDETCSPFSAGEAGEWRQRCLNALEGAPATARQAD